MTTKKSVLISLPVIVSIILAAVFYSASSNAHSWKYNPWQKALAVTFAPEAATITLAAGETKSIEVTATVNCKDTKRKLTTAVSPELAPYVSVSPTTIPACKSSQGKHNYQANRHWWQFWSWWKKDSGRQGWEKKKQGVSTVTLSVKTTAINDPQFGVYDGGIYLKAIGKRKTKSKLFPITVELTVVPVPPDPGELGKATLEGIDSDSDGVRDDIQRYIVMTYPESEKTRKGLFQSAKALQKSILESDDKDKSIANAIESDKTLVCLDSFREEDAGMVRKLMRAELLNTKVRLLAYLKYSEHSEGETFHMPFELGESACEFDVSSLGN